MKTAIFWQADRFCAWHQKNLTHNLHLVWGWMAQPTRCDDQAVRRRL